jgi:hypothetical protein
MLICEKYIAVSSDSVNEENLGLREVSSTSGYFITTVSLRFQSRLPLVDPRPGHVGYVGDKMTLEQVFSKYSGFP